MMTYPPKRILAPLDFSGSSQKGLDAAVTIAKVHYSDLVVMHVMKNPVNTLAFTGGAMGPPPVTSEVVEGWSDLKDEALQVGKENMNKILSNVSGVGKVQTELVWGKPADEIARLAEGKNFDLIVMSTHGRGSLQRMVSGSVTEAVIRKTRVPTLVVSADDEESESP